MARPADDSEKEVLEQFRNAVRNEVSRDQLKNDAYLLRWIRARDKNLNKALEMFRKSMEFRKEKDVSQVLIEPIPADFNEFFNCHLGGIDKCGRPVICAPLGEWDFRPMLEAGKLEDLLKFAAQFLEIMDMTLQEMWRNEFPKKTTWQHTQFTVIIDIKGLTAAKVLHKKSIDALLEATKMYEANYPETLGSAVVINAPWIFSTAFNMIKPLLSEHTISKIAIYDSKEANWKKAVLAVVDEDQIPPRYGGTLTDYITNPI